MTQIARPTLDLSQHPAVVSHLHKRYRDRRLFGVLALVCGSLLIVYPLFDGFGLIDLFPIALGLWVGARGFLAVASLPHFFEENPGLKVLTNGLALPWRSTAAARNGMDNVLPFEEIEEIKIPSDWKRSGITVVRRLNQGTSEFPIEAEWIPDVDALVRALDQRARIVR